MRRASPSRISRVSSTIITSMGRGACGAAEVGDDMPAIYLSARGYSLRAQVAVRRAPQWYAQDQGRTAVWTRIDVQRSPQPCRALAHAQKTVTRFPGIHCGESLAIIGHPQDEPIAVDPDVDGDAAASCVLNDIIDGFFEN